MSDLDKIEQESVPQGKIFTENKIWVGALYYTLCTQASTRPAILKLSKS